MSRHLFGWDLPPGVTMASIERAYGYDQPDWDWRPKCTRCGGFLTLHPTSTEPWEEFQSCDGQLHEGEWGSFYGIGEYECPQQIHEPHKVLMMAGTLEYRTCKRCGHVNKESVI